MGTNVYAICIFVSTLHNAKLLIDVRLGNLVIHFVKLNFFRLIYMASDFPVFEWIFMKPAIQLCPVVHQV